MNLAYARRKKLISMEVLASIPHILSDFFVSPVVMRNNRIPDEIVIDILSRLPADCVLQCRRVCKNWCKLTSGASFAELHLRRGANVNPPSIFVQQLDERLRLQNELDFNSVCDKKISIKVDTEWFQDKIAKVMPFVSCSVDGLLVFQSSVDGEGQINILNPLTKELVEVHAPFCVSRPCGIYRDPSTNEYKLLLIDSSKGSKSCYFTASLKTKIIKKLEYSSLWHNVLPYARMVPSEGSLHWFVTDRMSKTQPICNFKIMVFNTKTEKFRVLSKPGDEERYRGWGFSSMELLETKGKLWLFRVAQDELHVWVLLEDHANWTWRRNYTVSLNWSTKRFPYFRETLLSRFCPLQVKVLGINNGAELLISWFGRGVFWYNLEDESISEADIFERDKCCKKKWIERSCSYTKTLVRIAPLLHEEQVYPRLDLKFISLKG